MRKSKNTLAGKNKTVCVTEGIFKEITLGQEKREPFFFFFSEYKEVDKFRK